MSKNYIQLARDSIYTPGQRPKRRPRLLIYSRNKKGKTRFCATAPNGLIIDSEDGVEEEDRLKPAVWTVTEWQGLIDSYEYCKTPEAGKRFKWISLDSLPRIYNMALTFVRKVQEEKDLSRTPNMVDLRDYFKTNELVKGLLWNFHSLRQFGIIITSQEKMIEISKLDDVDEDSETSDYAFVADVPDGLRTTVNSVVDGIGRLYVVRGEFTRKFRTPEGKVVEREEKLQRRMWVSPHEMYDTGFRSRFDMPEYLTNPTVLTVVKAMREGISNGR